MFEKCFKSLLKRRVWVLIFCAILAVVSFFAMLQVKINTDVASYLPGDSLSKRTTTFLEENFDLKGDGIIAVTAPLQDIEAMGALSAQLKQVPHVKQEILWLGSFAPMFTDPMTGQSILLQPALWQPSQRQIAQKYYIPEGESGVFIFTLAMDVGSSSEEASKAMDDVKAIMEGTGRDYALGGTVMVAKNMIDSAMTDLPQFLSTAVVIIFLILLLTGKSFIEPFIFLLTIGLSILINMGSNILLGSISTVAFSAAAVLQLALAMDYAIFLMHAYNREIKTETDSEKAMVIALQKTTKTVFAGALTTIAGFAALFAMRFGLGYDLGMVLAKGVLLSFLTVCIFQPCLILSLRHLLAKTAHKAPYPAFKGLQRSYGKMKYAVLGFALLLFIPSFIGQMQVKYYYIESEYEADAVGAQKVLQNMGSPLVVAVPEADRQTHGAFLSGLRALNDDKKVINDISGYYTFIDPTLDLTQLDPQNPTNAYLLNLNGALSAQYFKNGYTFYTLMLNGVAESELSRATRSQIQALTQDTFENYYIGGSTQALEDLAAITARDFTIVAILSAVTIFVILMFTFKSVIIAFFLVLVIELAIFVNLSTTALQGQSINFMTYIIISAIQLGATVDYAILLTGKYRLYRADNHPLEAVQKAVGESAFSIVVSIGILVSACLSVYFIATDRIIREITMLIARGAIFSGLGVLLLLPCIFLVFRIKGDKKQELSA